MKICRKPLDFCGVPPSNGTHHDDFSLDQLHPVVFGENTCIAHAMVFIHTEDSAF
jgi:hypothetical protein